MLHLLHKLTIFFMTSLSLGVRVRVKYRSFHFTLIQEATDRVNLIRSIIKGEIVLTLIPCVTIYV